MIIGIDGNEANVSRRVGIGEWAYQLLLQFSRFSQDSASNVQYRIYLKDAPQADMPRENSNWQYHVFGPGKLWTQWRLPLDLTVHRPRPNVFFTPSHYAPRFSPVPTVTSVMDLSYFFFPELFDKKDLYQLINWTKYSVQQAKKIITISESSKDDIIKKYQVPVHNVAVVYPGIKQPMNLEPNIYGFTQLQEKYDLSDNFVLFVGTLQPRKNIVRLIEAFAKVDPSKKEKLQLVVVGKKGWLYEEILQTPERLGINDRVKFLHGISDEELTVLYKHALCYVLPSLYEGFGLPVLEAMKQGCPVITSKISSLPEAGGDAALYVDPKDTDDIAKKIEKLISDEGLRKDLVAKGYKQVEKFSWEKTAKETLAVLEEVVHMSSRT